MQMVGLSGRLRRFRASLTYNSSPPSPSTPDAAIRLSFEQYVAHQVREKKFKIVDLTSTIQKSTSVASPSSRIHRGIEALWFRLKPFLEKLEMELVSEDFSTVYLDLCELYQQNRRLGGKAFTKFLKKVIQEIRSLLKISYASRKISYQSCLIDEWRNKVKEAISEESFRNILMEEVREQQNTEQQRYELCRLCSQQVKLYKIREHVSECRKSHTILQKIEELSSRIEQAIQLVKQRHTALTLKQHQKTASEEKMVQISSMLLAFDLKKKKTKDRRCSLENIQTNHQLQDMIKLQMQQYMEDFGKQSAFTLLLLALKQKNLLQKRLGNLGIHSGKKRPISEKRKEKIENSNSIRQQNSHNNTEDDKENISTISHTPFPKHAESRSRKTIKMATDFENKTFTKFSSLKDLSYSREGNQPISIASFDILKVLGQGAFGKVYLARRKITQDIYALKAIKIRHDDITELESIRNEHQIFRKIGGDHLVKAPFSFSEKKGHIFVLEYMCGGDLRVLLDEQVYFEQEVARMYLAEMVLAIEHLHEFGIIHRDLKPQNVVIDRDGHIKLTDFGLSEIQMKEKLEKTRQIHRKDHSSKRGRRTGMVTVSQKKLIGTPDYIAPQIINSVSWNNYSIDWWSLGVIAYEFMIGTRPFCADSIEEVINNITNFTIEWPQVGYEEGMISPEAKDFISQLLNRNYVERLGAESINQIKDHPFFTGINWGDLKSSKPVHVPKTNTFQDYLQMSNDPKLREDLYAFIDSLEKKNSKTMLLNNFVRFDLLERETLQQSQAAEQSQARTLRRLKTMKCVQLCTES